jgi:hypothetical protein
LADRAKEISEEADRVVRLSGDKALGRPCQEALRKAGEDASKLHGRLFKVDVGADTRSLAEAVGAKLREAAVAVRKEASQDLAAERRSKEGVDLRQRFELASVKLVDQADRVRKARFKMQKAIEAAGSKEPPAADLADRAREVGDGEEAVGKALEAVRDIQADCNAALAGLKEKKALPGLTARLTEQAGKPLGKAVDGDFPAAQKSLASFRAALEAGKPDVDKAKAAGDAMARLLDRLVEVLDGLDDLPDVGELIATLSEIEWEQRAVVYRLRELADQVEDDLLKSLER